MTPGFDDFLADLEGFLEKRADGPRPNEAMNLLVELRGWRERFKRSSEAEQQAWRPIATAPESEGSLLLLVPTLYGKYNQSIAVTGMRFNGFWVIFNADEAIQRVEPTHWMPLPASPFLSEER